MPLTRSITRSVSMKVSCSRRESSQPIRLLPVPMKPAMATHVTTRSGTKWRGRCGPMSIRRGVLAVGGQPVLDLAHGVGAELLHHGARQHHGAHAEHHDGGGGYGR